MKEKILLTGGTGYIGSHTAVCLIEAGFEVIIVDDLSNSRIGVLDNIEKITGKRPHFHQFDLRQLDSTEAIFQQYNPKAVIHFAAKKAVGESVDKPTLYYDVNINSLLNLLKAMNKVGTQSIIFSSSCTVYGQPDQLPVTESTPFKAAESPYGNTKQICEEILSDNCRVNSDLQVVTLRYFNPVGAHHSSLIGELPLGVPNNLVPFITQTAMGKRKELKVFGSDYGTPDGTPIRDYIHVEDLAEAHMVALKRSLGKSQKTNFEFFNVGTGKGHSVLEVIQAFEKMTNEKLNYKITDRRSGDIEKIYADTRFAEKELGWKAQKDLEEMMKSAWSWEQNIPSLYPEL